MIDTDAKVKELLKQLDNKINQFISKIYLENEYDMEKSLMCRFLNGFIESETCYLTTNKKGAITEDKLIKYAYREDRNYY